MSDGTDVKIMNDVGIMMRGVPGNDTCALLFIAF